MVALGLAHIVTYPPLPSTHLCPCICAFGGSLRPFPNPMVGLVPMRSFCLLLPAMGTPAKVRPPKAHSYLPTISYPYVSPPCQLQLIHTHNTIHTIPDWSRYDTHDSPSPLWSMQLLRRWPLSDECPSRTPFRHSFLPIVLAVQHRCIPRQLIPRCFTVQLLSIARPPPQHFDCCVLYTEYIMSRGNLSGVYHFYTMAVTAATMV